MEINLNDFFQLGITLIGFYVCFKAGAEQAMGKLIRELEEAGVIKIIDEDDEV